jgi:hypothetical protein
MPERQVLTSSRKGFAVLDAPVTAGNPLKEK